MGFWRTHYFQSKKLFTSTSQTEVFTLPMVGLISNLMIEISALSGSTNRNEMVADMITKVEVIGNGSTVIKSYDGPQIQALNCFDDLRMPLDRHYAPSGLCYGFMDVRFGRYPGDEKYALDCGAWKSLELKITYTEAAGDTVETTGFKNGYSYITVYGLFAPVGAAFRPQGYIKSEEKRAITTAATTDYVLTLPTDYPFRRLVMFTETEDIQPNQAFTNITVDVNSGALKPLDSFDGDDFVQWQHHVHRFPEFRFHKRYSIDMDAMTVLYSPIRYIRGGSFTPTSNSGALFLLAADNDKWRIGDPGGSGDSYCEVVMVGLCPWGATVIDMERLSGEDGVAAMRDVWNCTHEDNIELKWRATTASVAISILLEQYVSA